MNDNKWYDHFELILLFLYNNSFQRQLLEKINFPSFRLFKFFDRLLKVIKIKILLTPSTCMGSNEGIKSYSLILIESFFMIENLSYGLLDLELKHENDDSLHHP